MNKDKVKLKHLLYIHKDLPEYPTSEDLAFEIARWYFEDGGRNYIDKNTSIMDLSNPVFTIDQVKSLIDKEETTLQSRIDEMLKKNIITIVKQTQHNTYYRFETNDYE